MSRHEQQGEPSSVFGMDSRQLDRILVLGMTDTGDDEPGTPTLPLHPFMERPGSEIGRYKLLQVLGEGGMGIVYLAEQAGPIRRRVALKVIKPGMDSARVIARFEAERQALALMDHPHVAHVYDAGMTPSGRPYFVMEYVKGVSITEYCDERRLIIEERLRLFLRVCDAVQHAHQKGLIHRDLKPSNILVVSEDQEGVPKVIDFGVAKAIGQALTERTLFTEDSQLLGTREYMSPEQAGMATEDIDTRSDIYSLGVLLYVLLTGVLPFDSDTFRRGGADHIRQIICEIDPKTPSTRVTSLGEEAKKVAESRRTEVVALARCLHRELEWIPLKAMRKKRTERYRSASELADDIENYLNGTALIAGPPSAVYRLRKFVQRNRAFVMGIATVVAVLIAGVVVSSIFAIRAERRARTLQAISDFLSNDLLASVDPMMEGQQRPLIEPMLDLASEGLEGKFEGEPLIEASILHIIGRTYRRLGKYEAAESNLKRAIELRRERLGTGDQEILLYMHELGWLYFHQSRYDEAERFLAEAVAGMRRVLSELDPTLLEATTRLAWVYQLQGRYEEAEKLQTDALEVVQRRLGPEHPYATSHMEGLAAAYRAQGRVEEAAELCRKALDISQRVYGEEHYATLSYTVTLAKLCRTLGRYGEAERLYVKALEGRRRLWGEEHRRTLTVMRYLGSLYRELKRHEEAEQLLVPALETSRRLFGDEDQATLRSSVDVARLWTDQGHYGKAEPLLLRAEETARRVFGSDHEITNTTVNNLIKLYESWPKPDEAAKWQAKLPRAEHGGE